jgi:UDP-N-acetylglucosamine 2-epimerase
MLKVINVVGARPNFMKVAPIVDAMKRREREFAPLVVHTGQHYDEMMSDAFLRRKRQDARYSVPDFARKYRATNHRRAGNEYRGGQCGR